MPKRASGKHLILWLTLVLLAGCVASAQDVQIGRRFDTSHANDIVKGQTKAEVQAWFGEPLSSVVSERNGENGRPLMETWLYVFSVGRPGHAKAYALSIIFDREGKVLSSSYKVTRE